MGGASSTQHSSNVKASNLAFPKEGVLLQVFLNIMKENKGKIFECPIDNYDKSKGMCKKRFDELTTTDVCEQIIKPSTVASQLSWCEQHKQSKNVGKANLFISHAWKYTFSDVVAALESKMKDNDGMYIGLIFSAITNIWQSIWISIGGATHFDPL